MRPARFAFQGYSNQSGRPIKGASRRQAARLTQTHVRRHQGEVMLRKLRERISAGQGGFSLIELLVVILIIGVLAAIALPAFLGQRSKGQDSSAKSAARNLVSSVESYYATEKTYVGAGSDNDVKKSGVFGTGEGQANLTAESSSGYTI